MKKIVIGIIIAVFLIVIFLFLVFYNDNSSDNSSIDKIKTGFIDAVENIRSYKVNATNELSTTVFRGEEIIDTEIFSNVEISVNITNRAVEHKTESRTVGVDGKDIVLIYMIDKNKTTGIGKEGNLSWDYEEFSQDLAESIWLLYSPIDHFAALVANEVPGKNINVNWKRLKDESYDDKDYYVLHSEQILNNTNPMLKGYSRDETYHTFWIDKTDYSLYKVKLEQTLDITGNFAGEDDKRYLMSEYIFNFYDINIPVEIQLPPEAMP
jgi:hypothetical protein